MDNKPTADLMVWSALSLIALIGGTGLMFAIYGRWSRAIGWHAEEAPVLDFRQPDEVRLTPSQKAACLLFATILVLFLLQLWWVRSPSTTVKNSPDSSVSTWASCCPTRYPEPGTFSSPSSGPQARSWRAVSSSPR